MRIIKDNYLLRKRKKKRLEIKNLLDFKNALKLEGYDIEHLSDGEFKGEIIKRFNIDRNIVEKIYMCIQNGDVTYRADDVTTFIDYIVKLNTFEEYHYKLCEKISEFKILHIDRIEYERKPLYQEKVDEILKKVDDIKKKISTVMSEDEALIMQRLEQKIDKQYIYTKDIELLKRMIKARENIIDERYDLETRIKTILIDVPEKIGYDYIPATKGSIEYYQHLNNNIPRMERLIKSINNYVRIKDIKEKSYKVNQSEALQDTINIAYATFDKKEFKAISGSNDVDGYCKTITHNNEAFEACKVNKLGKLGIGYKRINDSEKKIFEEINRQIEGGLLNNSGELTLYSKWEPCQSCYYVISQFIDKYPSIKIEIKYYYKYGK